MSDFTPSLGELDIAVKALQNCDCGCPLHGHSSLMLRLVRPYLSFGLKTQLGRLVVDGVDPTEDAQFKQRFCNDCGNPVDPDEPMCRRCTARYRASDDEGKRLA